jgi:hypoxanthine-guanine phosphoribosyltransferase
MSNRFLVLETLVELSMTDSNAKKMVHEEIEAEFSVNMKQVTVVRGSYYFSADLQRSIFSANRWQRVTPLAHIEPRQVSL